MPVSRDRTAGTAIAIAQFAPGVDEATNLRRIGELVAQASARGARLVLLPEYSAYFVDPFDASLAEHAQPLDGPFVQALRALAAQHGVHVVAGMVERTDDAHRVHNTLVAVDGGGVVARYRKLHLYDAFGQRESDWIAPGAIEPPQTFEADGIRFGMMTCYDLRFPEVSRTLVDAGADAMLVPAEWVRGPLKEHHWKTLLAARAIENTVYVAAADHPPPLGVGHSTILDPEGVTLAGIGTGEGVAVAVLEAAAIARVRERNPALWLRRLRVGSV